jgi:hypothetical protein
MALTFRVTDAGLAAATSQANLGLRLTLTQFKLGSGFNYTPNGTETALQGSILYTDNITGFKDMPDGSLVFVLSVLPAAGPFNFGEIGIYTDAGLLFAVAAFPVLQAKYASLGSSVSSTFTFNCHMNLAQRATQFTMTVATLPSAEIYLNWNQILPLASMPDPRTLRVVVNEADTKGDLTPLAATPGGQWSISGNMFVASRGFTLVNSTTTYVDMSAQDWVSAFPGTVATTLAMVQSLVVQGAGSVFRRVTPSVSGSNIRLTFSSVVTSPMSGTVTLWTNDPRVNVVSADLNVALSGVSTVAVTAASQALSTVYSAGVGVLANTESRVISIATNSTGAASNLYLPPGNTSEYTIVNTTSYSVTVYCSTVIGGTTAAGAGVVVPSGQRMVIAATGTDVFADTTALNTLNLNIPLPVSSGGTGGSSQAAAQTGLNVPSRTGSGASGAWSISVTGNAATADTALTAANATTSSFGTSGGGAVGSENQLVTYCNGYASAYLFNNSVGWGLYSAAGSNVVHYNRALGKATFTGEATALNNNTDYAIKQRLYFSNNGTEPGYIRANDPAWGMVFQPSINGSNSNSHLWTNVTGTGIMFLSPSGNLNTAADVTTKKVYATQGSATPNNPQTFAYTASGGYGGGYGFIDASYGMSIYSIGGVMQFALGSATATTPMASLSSANGGTFTCGYLVGNLAGTIDSGTTASTQAPSDSSTKVATTAFVKSQGYQAALGYTPVQQSGGSGQLGNKLYIGWLGGYLGFQVDSTNYGSTWPISVIGNAATATNATNASQALTQSSGDNSTNIATTAFVQTVIQANKSVKAWVNFNGNTGTINGSVGVSSVTRTASGEYRVNLSATQPDTNYAVVTSTGSYKSLATHHNGRTTTYYTITTIDSTNGTTLDAAQVYSMLAGD